MILYAVVMSNVAALYPGGSASNKAAVFENVPHSVGKTSRLIEEFTEGQKGSLHGKDKSWMSLRESECGLGTSPSGDVTNRPIMASSSAGAKAHEYWPEACSPIIMSAAQVSKHANIETAFDALNDMSPVIKNAQLTSSGMAILWGSLHASSALTSSMGGAATDGAPISMGASIEGASGLLGPSEAVGRSVRGTNAIGVARVPHEAWCRPSCPCLHGRAVLGEVTAGPASKAQRGIPRVQPLLFSGWLRLEGHVVSRLLRR
ncbi:hypothetical protein BDQ17DRAFT_1437947 [Cyathus striatus]|nr:hypothetical protein BDQ17DRAFT_1437947 [Cyathus striatus]